jgi:hypothetical protein
MRVDGVQSVPDGIEEGIFRHDYFFTVELPACLFAEPAGLKRIQERIPDARDAERIGESLMERKEQACRKIRRQFEIQAQEVAA